MDLGYDDGHRLLLRVRGLNEGNREIVGLGERAGREGEETVIGERVRGVDAYGVLLCFGGEGRGERGEGRRAQRGTGSTRNTEESAGQVR